MSNSSKLIDQGGYGCVYYPPFACYHPYNKDTLVSKIQVNNSTVKQEIYIGNIVKQIPNYFYYFAPIVKSCPINIHMINKHIANNKCKILKNQDNFIISSIPYIKGLDFKTIINNWDINSSKFFSTFFNSYYYLLHSLKILFSKNICHYDIKFENIIYEYTNKKNKYIIIDFGLSFLFSDIDNSFKKNGHYNNNLFKHYFYRYAPDYYLWCPEIQIISYIANNNFNVTFSQELINNLLTEIVNGMDFWKFFNDSFKEKYLNKLINFYSKFVNKSNTEIITSLLTYKKTWDLYSLTISYIKFITKNFDKINTEYQFLFTIFLEILFYCISPNPNSRPDIDSLIDFLSNTFNNSFNQYMNTKFFIYNLSSNQVNYINKIIPILT